MKQKIVVIGGGGHAKVVISILKRMTEFEIVGFTELEKKEDILGIPYLGDDLVLKNYYKKGITKAALGLGQIKSADQRTRIVDFLQGIGFEFPTIVSTKSIINEEVLIGQGTVVMDGVVINSGTKIEDFSIINTNSSIDHDCTIGSFTHIAPGATISGGVNIKDYCLIGTGSNLIQRINITSHVLLGVGSAVHQDIVSAGVYVGNPLKRIRQLNRKSDV